MKECGEHCCSVVSNVFLFVQSELLLSRVATAGRDDLVLDPVLSPPTVLQSFASVVDTAISVYAVMPLK